MKTTDEKDDTILARARRRRAAKKAPAPEHQASAPPPPNAAAPAKKTPRQLELEAAARYKRWIDHGVSPRSARSGSLNVFGEFGVTASVPRRRL
jgi:hypothetical protein